MAAAFLLHFLAFLLLQILKDYFTEIAATVPAVEFTAHIIDATDIPALNAQLQQDYDAYLITGAYCVSVSRVRKETFFKALCCSESR